MYAEGPSILFHAALLPELWLWKPGLQHAGTRANTRLPERWTACARRRICAQRKSTTRHDECFDSPIRMSQRSPGGVAPFGCTAARQEEVRNRDRTQIYRWPPKSVMLPEAVQHSIV